MVHRYTFFLFFFLQVVFILRHSLQQQEEQEQVHLISSQTVNLPDRHCLAGQSKVWVSISNTDYRINECGECAGQNYIIESEFHGGNGMGERDPACGMAWLDDYKIVTVNGIAVIYLAEGDKGNNEPQTEMLEIVYPWDVEGKKKEKVYACT